MPWIITKASHIGGREQQQDRVAILRDEAQQQYACILADGMGGHRGGELAAQTFMDCCEQHWPPTQAHEQWLIMICRQAQVMIRQRGQTAKVDPRTTCVLLLARHNQIWWTHVGDSRLYQFYKKQLILQSEDHSVVQLLVAMGKIQPEEMANHPDQNRLLKSIGGEQEVTMECQQTKVKNQTGFVLCSDGLWEVIRAKEMQQALVSDDRQAAEKLVQLAAQRGAAGGDNISVILARYQAKSIWARLWAYVKS